MSDNLETITYIIHKNADGKVALISIVMGQVNMMVGDIYNLKTHETEFNLKEEAPIQDGQYCVTARKWVHHLARPWRISLYITIEGKKP